MDFLTFLASQLDTRSFASLWYWIMVAMMWAGLTRQALGVPHDLMWRARQLGGAAQADVEHLARIQAQRYLYYWQRGKFFQVAFLAFVVAALAILATVFGFEFAQAILFLLLPLAIIGALSLRGAHLILGDHGHGAALNKVILRHRIYVQLVGFTFIFVTAMFGIVHNVTVGFHG